MTTKTMITLPASKSIGARFLTASYFAGTLSRCPKFEDCDDLRVIQKALLDLDLYKGATGSNPRKLDVHASGTAFRFMAAATASTPGADFILTGTPRLCSRPMTPMLEVLSEAGAGITPQGADGNGPYKVEGRHLKGGTFGIRGDVSSQFISALMLASPTWAGGMKLQFTTPLVSRPYAEMTAKVMKSFGVNVELSDNGVTVEQGRYLAPKDFKVEADWSAAGFFYEAASLCEDSIGIAGLVSPQHSLQGDSATAGIFANLGVATIFDTRGAHLFKEGNTPENIDIDLTDNPDLVPAFAVACCLNECRFRFSGVRNLRLKECDRLAAMQQELHKLGYVLTAEDDVLAWDGEKCNPEASPLIETYDDHRIAMAFAIAALHAGEIRIANPAVVEKSFENFWECIPALGLVCHKEDNVMNIKKQAI